MTAAVTCPLVASGRLRAMASWWAIFTSLLCAAALWRSVALVQDHTNELHKILEYAPNAVIVCSAEGDVVYANDAVRSIVGFSYDDLVVGGVEQVIPAALRDMHRAAFKRALVKSARGTEGVNYQRVLPVQHKNGGLVLCLVSVGSVRRYGDPYFFAFIAPVVQPESPERPSGAEQFKSPTLAPSIAGNEQ